MKYVVFTAAILALGTRMAVAQANTWVPDVNHSAVYFTVKHLSISNVRGHFGKLSGTIQLDQADISKSTVNITIDVTGVDTGVSPRDNDLKSANYFDVASYPTATFTSTAVARNSDGGLSVVGNLNLHGITKPVTLKVQPPSGPVDGQRNSKHMGFSASTTLDRTQFGIGAKTPNAMVGTEVKLDIEVDAVLQQAQQPAQ